MELTLRYLAEHQNGKVCMSRQHTNYILSQTVWKKIYHPEKWRPILRNDRPIPEGSEFIIRLGVKPTPLCDFSQPYALFPMDTALAVTTARVIYGESMVIPQKAIWLGKNLSLEKDHHHYWTKGMDQMESPLFHSLDNLL